MEEPYEWELRLTRRLPDAKVPMSITLNGWGLGDIIGEAIRAALASQGDDATFPVEVVNDIVNSLRSNIQSCEDKVLDVLLDLLHKYDHDDSIVYEDLDDKMIKAMKKVADKGLNSKMLDI